MNSHDLAVGNATPTTNPLNSDEFRRQGHLFVDFIADYYTNIENYPVGSRVKPGYLRDLLPQSAPLEPEPIEEIMKDIQSHIIPGITHWQHPSHFGYFPSSGSTAGVLGELLASGFNVVGFNWAASPAATELETIVMDWFGEILKLPKPFLFSGDGGGVIVGTTCEALIAMLVAARDQKLAEIGKGEIGKLVVYCSDQTHCGFQKAAKIVGILPGNVHVISTTKTASFSLSPDSLHSAVLSDKKLGLVPLFLCATIGTTSTTAVDPLEPLCQVAKQHNLWIHVDAAYGGSACICPEHRHVIDGVEGVNSFSLNAHKWFLTTLDCCCLWVKDPTALKKSLSTNPEYLSNQASDAGDVVDYKDWQLTLSRRFRSLKLWLVLRSYGVGGLRSIIRSHISMAEMFEKLVAGDKRFEVVVPRRFALVCFRLVVVLEEGNPSCGEDDDDEEEEGEEEAVANMVNRRLLERVNESGRVFMTHAVVGGIYMLRFAVGATLTEARHVVEAWKAVQEHADAMQGIVGDGGGSTGSSTTSTSIDEWSATELSDDQTETGSD